MKERNGTLKNKNRHIERKIIRKERKKSIYERNKTGDTFYYMRSDAFILSHVCAIPNNRKARIIQEKK
jgi:hypothetical protein